MKKVSQRIYFGAIGLYVASLLGWYGLHLSYGDTLWWLAILNVLAPHLFIPLPLLIVIGFIWPNRYIYFMLAGPLALFLWLYGALFWPSWPQATADQPPLTVMTFNIWGASRSRETAQVIVDQGLPDLVAIQELRPKMAEVLLEELADAYPYHQFNTRWASNGVGLLSRYPLTVKPAEDFVYLNREFQIIEVQVGERSVTLFNLHAQSTDIFSLNSQFIPVADWVDFTYQTRSTYLSLFMKAVQKQQGPVIVMGDFNLTDQSDAYQHLTAELNDAHRQAGWGFGHTFPASSKRYRNITLPPKQVRIDMIFYSDHFVALESRVGTTYGESDHRPVIATLAWRE